MSKQLKERIRSNQSVLATRINSTWPYIAEIVGATRQYDYIEFLGEYSPFIQSDLENIARACELHGMESIIKVDFLNRGYVAQKSVASGINGILFTDHTTADQVRESIDYVRASLPTNTGKLGYVNRRFVRNSGFSGPMDFSQKQNESILVGFMIEKSDAVINIDKICQVEGIDFIQFGPADYSMSCGYNYKEDHERTKAAELNVIRVAQKYGISVRVEINHPEDALDYLNLGIRHFAIGTEARILRDYWLSAGQGMRSIFER